MPHSFSHAPFRRRKDVVIAGPTAGLLCWHEAYAIRPGIYLPYPLPEVARQTRRHSGSTVFGGLGPEPLRGNAWVTGRCLGSIEPGNQRPLPTLAGLSEAADVVRVLRDPLALAILARGVARIGEILTVHAVDGYRSGR